MKKALIVILASLFFLSCHKSKNSSCGGYFIGIGQVQVSGTGTLACANTVVTINASNGQEISNYQGSILIGCNYGGGVYDHIHNYYYVYGTSPSNSNKPVLYSLNTKTGSTSNLGSPMLDSADSNYFFSSIICNSTTGKLYFLGNDKSVYELYEIIPTATSFTQRLIYTTDTPTAAPVIDENTGYIYFFYSPNIVKLDPVSGTSAIVLNFLQGDITPYQLVYNNNDGLFYGFNIYQILNPPQTSQFISIDPNSGNVHTIAAQFGGGGVYNAFDYCNNLYILYSSSGVVWYDLSGKLAKQASYPLNYGYIACLNDPVP